MLAGKGETENALVYIKKADQLDPGNKVSFCECIFRLTLKEIAFLNAQGSAGVVF